MQIKLIAIDLDGTLLNEQHEVSDEVKKSIQYAQDKGVQVVIATGRPFSGLKPIVETLNIQNDGYYCISNNGALVLNYKTQEVIEEKLLSFEDYLEIEALSRKLGVHLHVMSEHCLYTANRDIGKYTVFEGFLSNVQIVYRPIEEMSASERYFKCLLSAEEAVLEAKEKHVPKSLRDRLEVVKSAPFYLEFLNKESSKGNALRNIAQKLKINSSEIMCIGDHQNDYSMFEFAGTKVAMGNAIDLLKYNATFVTETNYNDGVSVAINKFI